jgi:hypothetical protein
VEDGLSRINKLCSLEWCDRKHNSLGFCVQHARQHKAGKELTPIKVANNHGKPCLIDGCNEPYYGKGYCQLHWKRARANGEFGNPKCLEEGCEKVGVSRGYCSAHYDTNRHLGLFGGKICESDGCDKTQVTRGLCRSHYQKIRMSGGWGGDKCKVDVCTEIATGLGYCRRHYWIYKQYNVDPSIYEQLELEQNKLCAICNGPTVGIGRLHLDHNHATGKIRGLLCSNCNTSLGGFMDNKELLLEAIKYLEKHE